MAVRRVLSALPGVNEVGVSSAFKWVRLTYDATQVDLARIEEALRAAGYDPAEEETVATIPATKGDPAWPSLGLRVTQTNILDLQMSGEFRKY